MHSDASIYDQLTQTLNAINAQIDKVTAYAMEREIEPSLVQNTNGQPAMVPLIVAKAQCLNGMAVLKASQKKGK